MTYTSAVVTTSNALHFASHYRGSVPDFFDIYALTSLSISYSGLTAGNSTGVDGNGLPNFAMYDRQADCSCVCRPRLPCAVHCCVGT